MKPSEARILLSEGRALFRPADFTKLGDPGHRTVEWCREAIGVLVEEACWAPEIHWIPSDEVRLEFRRAGNAEWALSAAKRAGLEARHLEAGRVVIVTFELESLPA